VLKKAFGGTKKKLEEDKIRRESSDKSSRRRILKVSQNSRTRSVPEGGE
jgi:hypothetical protein